MKFPSCLNVFVTCSVVSLSIGMGFSTSAMAQLTQSEAEYHTLVEQIANQKINIAHQQAIIGQQKDRMGALRTEISTVPALRKSVPPMLDKMLSNLEREILADYPFDMDARMFRLNGFKELMNNDAVSVGQKYLKGISVLQAEVNYGQSVVAKDGDHPVKPTIREGDDRFEKEEDGKTVKLNKKTGMPIPIFDGTYLNYGRTAYVYINKDGTSPLIYDLKKRAWVELKGSTKEIRLAMRAAKGEVAPSVVMAPVVPIN